MSLIRLAYASEATFEPAPVEKGIEPNVSRILLASRRNNPKWGLVGGLYYGDNRFFQYLEGEEKEVYRLFETLCQDPRHRNITKLLDEPLNQRTFTNWSMKYVPKADDVNRFLGQHEMTDFSPHTFDRTMTEQMIALIRQSSQSEKSVNYSDKRGTGSTSHVNSDKSMQTPLLVAAGVIALVTTVGGFLVFL